MIWLIGLVVWIGVGVLFAHRCGQAIGSGEDAAVSDEPEPGVQGILFPAGRSGG